MAISFPSNFFKLPEDSTVKLSVVDDVLMQQAASQSFDIQKHVVDLVATLAAKDLDELLLNKAVQEGVLSLGVMSSSRN